MLIVTILLCVALIVLGTVASKPHGWIALALAVLALLIATLNFLNLGSGLR